MKKKGIQIQIEVKVNDRVSDCKTIPQYELVQHWVHMCVFGLRNGLAVGKLAFQSCDLELSHTKQPWTSVFHYNLRLTKVMLEKTGRTLSCVCVGGRGFLVSTSHDSCKQKSLSFKVSVFQATIKTCLIMGNITSFRNMVKDEWKIIWLYKNWLQQISLYSCKHKKTKWPWCRWITIIKFLSSNLLFVFYSCSGQEDCFTDPFHTPIREHIKQIM